MSTGGAKKNTISSSAILSSDPAEWLNDAQVANDNLLMVMPERGRLRLNYPRNGPSIGDLFRSKFVQGIVQGAMQDPLSLLWGSCRTTWPASTGTS